MTTHSRSVQSGAKRNCAWYLPSMLQPAVAVYPKVRRWIGNESDSPELTPPRFLSDLTSSPKSWLSFPGTHLMRAIEAGFLQTHDWMLRVRTPTRSNPSCKSVGQFRIILQGRVLDRQTLHERMNVRLMNWVHCQNLCLGLCAVGAHPTECHSPTITIRIAGPSQHRRTRAFVCSIRTSIGDGLERLGIFMRHRLLLREVAAAGVNVPGYRIKCSCVRRGQPIRPGAGEWLDLLRD